jgi:hypothetical protein
MHWKFESSLRLGALLLIAYILILFKIIQMKPYTCYPYSYGDDGGCFSDVSNCSKICLVIGASCAVSFAPAVAGAADATLILSNIEKAVKELDGTNSVTRRISPVGAAACFISGVCISQAKSAMGSGNVPAAAAFACGAAIALCGDRVAANYGI